MEEKKKSNALVVVVVAILCLLIGGVGGYFIYNSINRDNNLLRDPMCPTCNNTNEKETSVENESQSNDNNSIVVDTPVYNVTTKTIPKTLIGKYINTEEASTYVEIKEDGTVVFSASACEGVSLYSTDKNIDYLAFYQKQDEFTLERNSFELIMKPGLNHNFGGEGILSLFFKINGDITTGKNISLEALDNYGCSASKIYKK